MLLTDTHRSVAQRLRLSTNSELGAGNFFWHACRVAEGVGDEIDRPVLWHAPGPGTEGGTAEYSLAALRAQAVAYADWYSAHGIGPGARVGLQTTNGLRGLLHHIAVTSVGAATVLANPRMAPDLTAEYFRRSGVSGVIADPELLEACLQAGVDARLTAVTDMVVGRPDAVAPGRAYRHGPDDVVLISHSSGTTGIPKPTVFTHQGFFVGKRERLWSFPSRRADRLLSALPHSHSAGLSYVSLALLLGLPTLMIDDVSGPGVAAAMNSFNPTVVVAFPVSLADLPIDALSAEAKGAVHTWMGMGDASHERHIRPLVRLGRRPQPDGWLPGSVYVDGLGSSEMGMVLFRAVHTPDSDNYRRMIGKPVEVVRQAAVLDEAGDPAPVGSAGLLGVRTPSVTPGYWGDPELTERSRRGAFFLTGDVVRQDEDGNFYHLDRTPDVITTAGGPVYSLPVEEVVLTVTGALDAAVVGADDPEHAGMSRPVAIVLFKDAAPGPGEELLDRCNAALAGEGLAPLGALVVAAGREELPVGVTGKVLKRVLRERHRGLLTGPGGPGGSGDARGAGDASGAGRPGAAVRAG